MKRLLLLAAALLAVGSLATAPDGSAAPAGRATPAIAHLATTTSSSVTLTWLRNNMIGFDLGPSRATGYGRSEITAFTRGCPECDWYRVDNRLTNHQPTSPLVASRTADLAKRRGGFCWPWENFLFSGDGCWNDMSTWDWGQIFDNFNYHPVWDPLSTSDRIVGCYHGLYNGFTGGVIGKAAVGILLDMADLVRTTPAGIAYTLVGGCTFSLFHN